MRYPRRLTYSQVNGRTAALWQFGPRHFVVWTGSAVAWRSTEATEGRAREEFERAVEQEADRHV